MSSPTPNSINSVLSSSLSPPLPINTQCNYYPCAINSNWNHNTLMNPYFVNPYTINIAAANLAATSTTSTAPSSTNGNQASNAAPANTAYPNPYAAAIAANPALAQAAALNAYTRNIAAVQQQINGMVGLNTSLNQNGTDITTLTNGIDENGGENQEEDTENETKNKKNKLKVEHDGFYNMKPLLAENILSSDYFKSLYRFKTYHEVIDETTRFCRNVEPLMVGLSRKPSTAFCILYKFFRCVLFIIYLFLSLFLSVSLPLFSSSFLCLFI